MRARASPASAPQILTVQGTRYNTQMGKVTEEAAPLSWAVRLLPEPAVVADRLPHRLRRRADLFSALVAALSIAAIVLMGVYAHSTTQGVSEDIRMVLGSVIRQVLLLPFSLLESLFVIIAPVAVIVALTRRQEYRAIAELIATGMAAALIGAAISQALPLAPPAVVDSLLVVTATGGTISLDVVLIVLSAVLTVAGERDRLGSVRWSWYGVWFLAITSVLRGTATVPGALVTVLLGHTLGLLARWIFGFEDRRAGPADLVSAALRCGLTPVQVVRTDLADTAEEPLQMWTVSEGERARDAAQALTNPQLATEPVSEGELLLEVSNPPSGQASRHYQVLTTDDGPVAMHLLDPDSGIGGTLGDLWDNVRLRGISRWVAPSLKAGAERALLTAQMAARAGVRTPTPIGIAEAGDSIATLWQDTPPMAPLSELSTSGATVSDAMLHQAWQQMLAAHSRGVTHRNLDLSTINADADGNVWIVDWDAGDVASSPLGVQIDRVQLLVHLAEVAGAERALSSAAEYFDDADLTKIAMVMQPAVLPPGVRARLKGTDLLNRLRVDLAGRAQPEADAVAPPTPLRLQRFQPRTVIMALVGVTALLVVMGSLNFDAIRAAVSQANIWWILAAFLLGGLTLVGAAIPLVAFSPIKLSLWETTIAQAASSLANLVAPAGVGPAAFNLRYLSKKGMKVPIALATVSLVQISQFLVSSMLLLVIVVLTGTTLAMPIPTMTIVWGAALVAAIAAAVLAVPRIRSWVWAKLKPTWDQIYPHLLWVVGHPREMLYALAGNLLGDLGFIAAFGASLAAFGYFLSPLSLSVTFLVSNTLGAVIPAPGGIGPVEAALTAGLQVAGIPTAVAVSTAVIYRLVTFYGRLPLGWLASRWMQRKDLI